MRRPARRGVRGPDAAARGGEGELEREVEFLPVVRGDGRAARGRAGHRAARARRAARVREARVFAALLGIGPARLASTSPRTSGRTSRRRIVERFGDLLERAPAAAGADRDDRGERRRELAGHHVRLAHGDRDRREPADVVRAFRIARDVTGAVERWADVEALDGLIDPRIQNELMNGVDWLVETTSRWYLVQAAGRHLAEAVGDAQGVVRGAVRGDRPDRSGDVARGARARRSSAGSRRRARRRSPSGTRSRPSSCTAPTSSRSPTRRAVRCSRSPAAFFLLGERLELDWLENQLEAMPGGSRWQRWALQSMEDDLFTLRRQLREAVLDECGGAADRRGGGRVPRVARRDRRAPAAVHAEPRHRRHERPRAAHRGAAADPVADRLMRQRPRAEPAGGQPP